MELCELLGKKLKEIRESKRLTQQEFAEKCNMHHTTIALIETGKRTPSLKAIKQFVKILDIDYIDLFDFKNSYSLEKSNNELKLELGKLVKNFDSTLLQYMVNQAKSINKLYNKENKR